MATTLLVRLRVLRRFLGRVAWRGAILLLVFSCGLIALRMGVGFSERSLDGGVLTQIYYVLGLFVLGGLDLGIPVGGSSLGRGLLWFSYFAAPIITTASLVEGVLRAIAPQHWRLRRLRRHVIIVGCSRVGRLYLQRLREIRPRQRVVMVEMRHDHPAEAEVSEGYRALFLSGDIRDDGLLDALGLDRAERVMLVTGDDYANLDTAAKILARVPELARRTVVRVSRLRLMRTIAGTRVATTCAIFNVHQIAASTLVRTQLVPHFNRTEDTDVVVLAGFGRFGQTVLDQLQRQAQGKFHRVIIIDNQAERLVAIFAQQVGFSSFYERQVVEGDLRDPRVWQRAAGIREAEPAFILGSGDEDGNLSTALWVKSQFPNAYVVARRFYRSHFA
ncbi:MAG: NAD-binding protein, partial [Myxococcota bacterium]